MEDSYDYDVIVIGGGPGGSTAGALLAERGWRVAVLEKDRHPRFHIGESLLPQNNALFERLGVLEEVERISMIKRGAQFSSMYHNKEQTFYFANALDKDWPYGFEVHRSELDQLLFENARRRGARMYEETRVVRAEFDAAGVTVGIRTDAGERDLRARFLIDASGRDTFLGNKLKLKQAHRKHASAAIYGHYRNAQRLPGEDAGNITIYWFDHGWFWFIPQTHDITSVGAVCWPYYLKQRKGSLEDFLDATVAMVPALAERLRDAQRIAPVTATGNYSYECRRAIGARHLMVGDAFAFVDPVFSTGVYLAMSSAFRAADTVEECLRRPEKAAAALTQYERGLRRSIATFSWFIFRITTPAMRELLLNPRNVLRVEEAMVSLLAGDIYRANGVRWRIGFFKLVYYLTSLRRPRMAWAAARRRRQIIRPVGLQTDAASMEAGGSKG